MAENNKIKFVIDSSVVVSFLLDEKGTDTEALFKRFTQGEITFIAPNILCYEVGNVLRTRVLQKKLSTKRAFSIFQVFFDLHIELHTFSYERTLKLAIQKRLSFYDASYIYLAKSQNIPLYTLDKHLHTLN